MMTKLIAIGILIGLAVTACQKEPDNAVTAYDWYQQTEPANGIMIVQNNPEAVAARCPQAQHAGACANVGGQVCVIDFVGTWHGDWKLLEHELRHCLGYNHK
jgi:hypothetical protein